MGGNVGIREVVGPFLIFWVSVHGIINAIHAARTGLVCGRLDLALCDERSGQIVVLALAQIIVNVGVEARLVVQSLLLTSSDIVHHRRSANRTTSGSAHGDHASSWNVHTPMWIAPEDGDDGGGSARERGVEVEDKGHAATSGVSASVRMRSKAASCSVAGVERRARVVGVGRIAVGGYAMDGMLSGVECGGQPKRREWHAKRRCATRYQKSLWSAGYLRFTYAVRDGCSNAMEWGEVNVGGKCPLD
jgi:hypothetical protein